MILNQVFHKNNRRTEKQTGTQPEDLGNILRFSAFWVDKMVQRQNWGKSNIQESN
ncbi:hypothetical protein [Anabaena sp. WA102]|jgi:CRISPR-associated protein Cmr2|uniref:hypothetical protein n=1 Tax=Anabaena sp. WA102 TaxID=1647413 RepID=UPI000B231D48|nr:hypothetical protein [Anabaena sp. WA102]